MVEWMEWNLVGSLGSRKVGQKDEMMVEWMVASMVGY